MLFFNLLLIISLPVHLVASYPLQSETQLAKRVDVVDPVPNLNAEQQGQVNDDEAGVNDLNVNDEENNVEPASDYAADQNENNINREAANEIQQEMPNAQEQQAVIAEDQNINNLEDPQNDQGLDLNALFGEDVDAEELQEEAPALAQQPNSVPGRMVAEAINNIQSGDFNSVAGNVKNLITQARAIGAGEFAAGSKAQVTAEFQVKFKLTRTQAEDITNQIEYAW